MRETEGLNDVGKSGFFGQIQGVVGVVGEVGCNENLSRRTILCLIFFF